MTKKIINRTNYADIWGIYDNDGKIIGTAEVRLAGRDVNTYFSAWGSSYSRRELRSIFYSLG